MTTQASPSKAVRRSDVDSGYAWVIVTVVMLNYYNIKSTLRRIWSLVSRRFWNGCWRDWYRAFRVQTYHTCRRDNIQTPALDVKLIDELTTTTQECAYVVRC